MLFGLKRSLTLAFRAQSDTSTFANGVCGVIYGHIQRTSMFWILLIVHDFCFFHIALGSRDVGLEKIEI
jgi:hypothetical protein